MKQHLVLAAFAVLAANACHTETGPDGFVITPAGVVSVTTSQDSTGFQVLVTLTERA